MLATDLCEEYVASMQDNGFFNTALAIVHIDYAIEYREYFFSIIDVPSIRRVSPVQAYACAVNICDIDRAPRPVGGELTAADDFQASRQECELFKSRILMQVAPHQPGHWSIWRAATHAARTGG